MDRAETSLSQQSPAASKLNQELTELLLEQGKRGGFEVASEYGVPGGRLDVVWSWNPPTPIPGLVGSIPVVGFEVESNWRTRKHVKGDLLTLRDAGVALGIIVLAGADARDDSLRRFATSLVDRPGAQVLICTAEDIRALAACGDAVSTLEEAARVAARGVPAAEFHVATAEHVGKYRPLWAWLRRHDRREIRIAFSNLEGQAGVVLPNSSRDHLPHWYSYQGSAVARAIIDAGWHASRIDLEAQTVTLVPRPSPSRR